MLVAPGGPGQSWSGLGDPTEVALLAAAGKFGLSRDTLEGKYPRLHEVPFDSQAQRMTTAHALPDGEAWGVVKGPPEARYALGADGPHARSWDEALEACGASAP